MILLLFFIFLGLSSISVSHSKSYDGYQVLRFRPQNERQAKLLTDFVPDTDGAEIRFWSGLPSASKPVDILISPSKNEAVLKFADQNNFEKPEVLIADVQKLLEPDETKARSRIQQGGRMTSVLNPDEFFNNFRRLSVIYSFMDRLAEMYPRLISIESIGKTYEGREMRMMRISSSLSQGRQSNSSKPIFWIDAGIHAREWAAPPTAIFLAYALLSQYNKQDDITKIVNNFEWHILPVANPDGYEFTHTDDRLWRKTRSRNSYSSCRGVDPNRNFGFHWRETGASNNPCSETYAGPKAFSEVETMNIASHLWSNRQRLLVYIALHAYSQLWLTPWGYTTDLPADYKDLYSKARRAADAVERVYGTRYQVGSSTRVLYAAAGGSDDWAKGVAGGKYVYTVELRPAKNAMRGFVLSASEIKPCSLEMLAGIVQLAKDIIGPEPVIETRRQSRKKADRS